MCTNCKQNLTLPETETEMLFVNDVMWTLTKHSRHSFQKLRLHNTNLCTNLNRFQSLNNNSNLNIATHVQYIWQPHSLSWKREIKVLKRILLQKFRSTFDSHSTYKIVGYNVYTYMEFVFLSKRTLCTELSSKFALAVFQSICTNKVVINVATVLH